MKGLNVDSVNFQTKRLSPEYKREKGILSH